MSVIIVVRMSVINMADYLIVLRETQMSVIIVVRMSVINMADS